MPMTPAERLAKANRLAREAFITPAELLAETLQRLLAIGTPAYLPSAWPRRRWRVEGQLSTSLVMYQKAVRLVVNGAIPPRMAQGPGVRIVEVLPRVNSAEVITALQLDVCPRCKAPVGAPCVARAHAGQPARVRPGVHPSRFATRAPR